jgi:hypothetical protein
MSIDLLNRYFGAALYHQVHATDPTTGATRSRERAPAPGAKSPDGTVRDRATPAV